MKRLILLMLALLMLAGCARKRAPGDTGNTYPYTYKETDAGIELTIKGDFGERNVWMLEEAGENAVTVDIKQKGSKKATVSITPAAVGMETLILTLREPGEGELPGAAVHSIILDVIVDSTMKASLQSHRGNDLAAEVSGPIDERSSYQIVGQPDGSMLLRIDGPGLWEAHQNALAEVEGPIYDEAGCEFTILSIEEAQQKLSFEQQGQNTVLEIMLVVDERGNLSLIGDEE